MTVDDVLMPVMDRPESLKETLQALLPIRLFAAALRDASLAADGHEQQLALSSRSPLTTSIGSFGTRSARFPSFSIFYSASSRHPACQDYRRPQRSDRGFRRRSLWGKGRIAHKAQTMLIDRIYLYNGASSEPQELKHGLKTRIEKHGPRGLVVDPITLPHRNRRRANHRHHGDGRRKLAIFLVQFQRGRSAG